jgi:hypothetical protein
MPELNDVFNHYRGSPDVLFFAPALDDVNDLVKFLSKYRFSYIVLGNSKLLCEKLGITSPPANIIVDSNGVIEEEIASGKAGIAKALTAAIDKVLAKTKPR